MCGKRSSLITLVLTLALLGYASVGSAATVSFHEEAPTPGPHDVYNLVGASRDANNVGTTDYDSWLNDVWTYVALDRAAQGQTFVTGGDEPVYMLTGVWIQHVGYTENTSSGTNNNGTWYAMPVNSSFGIRITDPCASDTEGFVLSSETYTVTRNESNASLIPAGVTSSANGTGTWIHFVLDTPIAVAANTMYGFDVVSMTGNANMFFETLGIKDTSPSPPGNPYTAGTAYRSGANGSGNNVLTVAPGDRVFVVELVGAPPASASIPYPANNATGVETDPVLSWNAGYESTQSKVYLGISPDSLVLQTTIIHTEGVDRYSHTVTGLAYSQVYYWRVDEVPQTGPEVTGDVWTFTTGTTKASNPDPYDNEICVFIDPSPNLSWKAGLESTQSKVYFGTNPDSLELQTTITHTQGLERYSYPVTGLVNEQDYYWRVDQVPQTGPDITGNVWNFKTIPIIPITDPTLVGWWKFDEGPGKAIDWSGLNQHGTVYGGATSGDGYDGGAIGFDYIDDYVDLPIGSTISTLNSMTITTWVNFPGTGEAMQRMYNFGNNDVTVYMYLTPSNGNGVPQFGITTTGAAGESQVVAPSALPTDDWHHMAVTINGSSSQMIMYIDGAPVITGYTTTLPSDIGDANDNWLGRSDDGWVPPDPYFGGSLDDFRIYNYALSQDEIELVMRINPLLAWNPSPANGSTTDIEHVLPLSWSPGESAAQHDVYLGTDANAVADANESDTTGIYQGRQLETTFTPTDALKWGQTYYWRIDEYNTDATITEGGVWNFTVADYLVLDDFEDYNDFDNRVYFTWTDGYGSPAQGIQGNGTGSTVGYTSPSYAETSIVHEGLQSMPVGYDNTDSPYYSQADRTWDTPQDWTREGVVVLTLWFQGYRQSVGGISYNAATQEYTMTGSGTDIWDVTDPRETGFHDEFHFAYKQLNGEGEIIAKIESIQNTDGWAKAGVMIRNTEFDSQTPDANSANVLVCITPAQGVSFQYRTERGGAGTSVTDANFSAPHWVRLTRSGNTFTAYHSEDGQTWLSIGDADESWMEIPTMNANTYIGLAVTSHNADLTCEAVFSNVSTQAGSGSTITPAGPFTTSQDVGIFSNNAETLYVILKDNDGDSHLVEHPEPNATQKYPWQEWNIDLREFSSEGVNLDAITQMSIGVGDPEASSPTSEGKIYIDDIRLYMPKCVSSEIRPAGDFNNDCLVDYLDLQILTDNWLLSGNYDVTPVAPGGANLVAHYEFNGNFNDSSNGYHGDANGASIFTDPARGQVARFDGVNDYVDLPIDSLVSTLTNCTFATWVDFSNVGGSWQRIFDFGSDTTFYMFLTPRIGTADPMRFAITISSSAGEEMVDASDTLASGWHHVAVTINADNDTISLYLDGLLVDASTTNILPSDLGETTNNWLGRSQWDVDAYFAGSLDDFRIYDRALTQGEIGSLAGRTAVYTQPLDILLRPVDSAIDMNSDNTIDFKDYAELVSIWLEEELWPGL